MTGSPLIMLSPVLPTNGDTGLAMRAGATLAALSRQFAVQLVVVPVAGPPAASTWAGQYADGIEVMDGLSPSAARSGLISLLERETWRARLSAVEPLPELARRASPALADQLLGHRTLPPGTPVHVFRLYLAPLGLAIAERLGSPWVTIDLDDDDEALLRDLGEREEADAYARLLKVFGPAFSWLSLAARTESEAVAARTGLPTVTLPNAIEQRERVRRPAWAPGKPLSLLFVGNLTYGPNAQAAETLAGRVRRSVSRLVDGPVTVTLAGRYEPGSAIADLGEFGSVRALGYVDDLRPCYESAHAVAVPLAAGAGTRIKVLEAFAYGVPVVATTLAVRGLDAEDGRHLLLADRPRHMARALARLAEQPTLAETLVLHAAALVEERFSLDVVARQLLEIMPES